MNCDERGFECSGTESIEKILIRNIGKVVTVFAETGGEAGGGFTGLVARVEENAVKLITSIPSGPFESFHRDRHGRDCDFSICEHCRDSHFGSALIIPICKITAVSVVEI